MQAINNIVASTSEARADMQAVKRPIRHSGLSRCCVVLMESLMQSLMEPDFQCNQPLSETLAIHRTSWPTALMKSYKPTQVPDQA
jgi:hypothetical protein